MNPFFDKTSVTRDSVTTSVKHQLLHPGSFQFIIKSVFGLTYLMMPSVGDEGNDHKTTCTKNLNLSVKTGENLRSIRLQMSP